MYVRPIGLLQVLDRASLGHDTASRFFDTAGRDGMESVEQQRKEWEKKLFPAEGLPGGGQLEIRMQVSANLPDPDVLKVARRVKPFNPESWYAEWTTVAEENEELAAGFERDGLKITAHEFYRRATDFYRRALVFMPEA